MANLNKSACVCVDNLDWFEWEPLTFKMLYTTLITILRYRTKTQLNICVCVFLLVVMCAILLFVLCIWKPEVNTFNDLYEFGQYMRVCRKMFGFSFHFICRHFLWWDLRESCADWSILFFSYVCYMAARTYEKIYLKFHFSATHLISSI